MIGDPKIPEYVEIMALMSGITHSRMNMASRDCEDLSSTKGANLINECVEHGTCT